MSKRTISHPLQGEVISVAWGIVDDDDEEATLSRATVIGCTTVSSRVKEVVAIGTLHYHRTEHFLPETHCVEFLIGQRVRTVSSYPPRDNTPSPWVYKDEDLSDAHMNNSAGGNPSAESTTEDKICQLENRLSGVEAELAFVSRKVVNPYAKVAEKLLEETRDYLCYHLFRECEKPIVS